MTMILVYDEIVITCLLQVSAATATLQGKIQYSVGKIELQMRRSKFFHLIHLGKSSNDVYCKPA